MKKLLELAVRHCEEQGHRLTEPRQTVLEIIARAKKPIGAYDIIDAMPAGTKPPTVYRALEFWQQEGFVHEIASLNAYTTCHADHLHAGSQFMVCDGCGDVEEVHLCHLPPPFEKKMAATGFTLARWNAELRGICRKCSTGDATFSPQC